MTTDIKGSQLILFFNLTNYTCILTALFLLEAGVWIYAKNQTHVLSFTL